MWADIEFLQFVMRLDTNLNIVLYEVLIKMYVYILYIPNFPCLFYPI